MITLIVLVIATWLAVVVVFPGAGPLHDLRPGGWAMLIGGPLMVVHLAWLSLRPLDVSRRRTLVLIGLASVAIALALTIASSTFGPRAGESLSEQALAVALASTVAEVPLPNLLVVAAIAYVGSSILRRRLHR